MQKRSLHWMLQRERSALVATTPPPTPPPHERHWQGLHMAMPYLTQAGELKQLYIHRQSGALLHELPEWPQAPPGVCIRSHGGNFGLLACLLCVQDLQLMLPALLLLSIMTARSAPEQDELQASVYKGAHQTWCSVVCQDSVSD